MGGFSGGIRRPSSASMVGLLMLALALVAASCGGGGVAQEEFDDLQNELARERTKSKSLGDQLEEETSRVAAIREQFAESEIRDAVLRVFRAWNRKDLAGYVSGFTEQGLTDAFGGLPIDTINTILPDIIGSTSLLPYTAPEVTVTGDTATVESTLVSRELLFSTIDTMVRVGDAWKIDAERPVTPDIPAGTTVVNMQLTEFAFGFDPGTITGGNIAFRLMNLGTQAHEVSLARVPNDVDIRAILDAGQPPPDGVVEIARVQPMPPGTEQNMVFATSLDPGRYVLLCFLPDVDDPDGTPHFLKGQVGEFTVN